MSEFELEAQVREGHGKAAARRMRREQGIIPAIIYGAKKDPMSIDLDHNKVLKASESEAFYSQVLTIKVDKKAEKVVLKDVQRHAYKPIILHMDFMRIDAKSKLTMTVPLHFINEETAKGVKVDGGVVAHLLNEVEIACLPADLPESIVMDMENVELEQVIHLSDLKLPKGVEIPGLEMGEDHDLAIAAIHAPKRVEEVEDAAPEAPETEVEQGGDKEEPAAES